MCQDEIPPLYTSIVITAAPVEPALDRRNAEIFNRTLFSRDDQIFHTLAAGIDAGQHEGGGKSIEVRRFGFNLDHGGVNGGLKVLVDNVQQNQTTQGHGQGYLGSLKAVSPELVQEVSVINGPFSAEYGDFSGLGVVHIRMRESLADRLTARIQGGSFETFRGFLGWSPQLRKGEALAAWEGSRTEGPFLSPLGYRRNNFTGSYTRRRAASRALGFKLNAGTNRFNSSGQLPLDEVAAGRLDRFGTLDSTEGGAAQQGTAGVYYRQDTAGGGVFRADGFVGRSLVDLYSNFTFFLNNPVAGDAFQQHDSRLQQGANAQWLRPQRVAGLQGMLTAGANFHDNQINVALYPRVGRVPTGVTTRDHAHVTNAAAYAQQNVSLLAGRLEMGAGLRFDEFRFAVGERAQNAAVFQPKANLSATPWRRVPVTLYANYGRGISTADARVVVERPDQRRVAATDFYQAGAAHRFSRVAASADVFWIERSNEQVWVADDGTYEFFGPSRAYGWEAKISAALTRRVSLSGGMTKVGNAYYKGTRPRVYVDRAPHLVAHAGLTVSSWKGWSGSVRLRAINHYRLDGEDARVMAAGHTVIDCGAARKIRRGVELSLGVDNLTGRAYYETQNYFESRLAGQEPRYRIHGTPGYPATVMAGLTLRLWGK